MKSRVADPHGLVTLCALGVVASAVRAAPPSTRTHTVYDDDSRFLRSSRVAEVDLLGRNLRSAPGLRMVENSQQ